MRLLLSFIVLALLLGTIVVVFYYKKRQILIIFGVIKPDDATAKGEEAQPAPMVAAMDSATHSGPPGGMTLGRGASQSLSAQSLSRSGSFPVSERGGGGAAPMIVVESNDASRGASLPYDSIAEACGNWAEAQRIGAGGAAVVFRADLPRYGPVAIKRFHPSKEGSGREWTRELEALSQCRHPNILEIIGHSDEGPENLIIMPLMEGGTLGEAIPSLWWATRCTVLGQVVRAVSFLHGKKVVHRDIKSSNVLLDSARRHARLADFGLAKDQVSKGNKTCHGTTGIVVGSPGYMAPELMMRPANEKTDSFALGVVFLEILTALPAWENSEGGMVLTDRAVEDGLFVESLIDKSAQWPGIEIAALSGQAVVLTLFDPNSRKTVISVERDATYTAHLERANSAESSRFSGPRV